MVLLIDITNARSRVAFISARRAIWRTAPSRDATMRLLASARRARLLPRRGAAGVVALIGQRGAARDASWSAVRAAVATANALAFAWGVPAATAAVAGAETEAELAAIVIATAKRAGKRSRASATYDGEPNISKPKTV